MGDGTPPFIEPAGFPPGVARGGYNGLTILWVRNTPVWDYLGDFAENGQLKWRPPAPTQPAGLCATVS